MGHELKPCACGCGQPTQGTYTPGHRPLKSYPAVALGDGTQRVHTIRAEKALGHKLPPGAEVHHVDGNKAADAQLVICPSKAYHRLLHVRMRVQDAGGNPNTQRICGTCQSLRLIEEMAMDKGKPDTRCKACLRRIAKERGYGTIKASATQGSTP